jgi:ketosteroid isomerase-like protein
MDPVATVPTLHPNAAAIARFYAAFAALDAGAMAACYAPAARFEDEVFTLDGRDNIGAMWAMLCEASKANGPGQWRLEVANIAADAVQGSADWQAWYRFSATGRAVHNRIHAQLRFRDGLIVDHRDSFSFWAWARQALGLPGLLLGWSPFLRAKVVAQAAAKLAIYKARRGS